MGKLLFDSKPIIIDRELATAVGLNESLIVQQIHYSVISNSKGEIYYLDEHCWAYVDIEYMQNTLAWLTTNQISKYLISLGERQLLHFNEMNVSDLGSCGWYRINYERLDNIISKTSDKGV